MGYAYCPTSPTTSKAAEYEQKLIMTLGKLPFAVQGPPDADGFVHLSHIMDEQDVVCGDPHILYHQVRDLPLKRAELAGIARAIFDWCAERGFRCYLAQGSLVPMTHNYSIKVKK